MKVILFCQNNYAFGILNPIKEVLRDRGYDYLWFITEKIVKDFPYREDNYTTSVAQLKAFSSDAIFVPGNEVPYYLRGLKVQVFHGLAGEKKGHFRIRHYFDLYLTQGPYFTKKFNELKRIHRNFDVIETGWPKLDVYATDKIRYEEEKEELLKKHNAKKVILYAPTFSPKLTSAPFLVNQIKELAKNSNYVILLKFHPLMDAQWIETYKTLAEEVENIIFQTEKNIIKFLLIADILVSDTSSVIYEYLLLDKPVITFNNISDFNNHWYDTDDYNNLVNLVDHNLKEDPYAKSRQAINEQFHPYQDGKSALRMVESTIQYIKANGVPKKRKLSFLRRLKIHSMFGKP
ncbi:CDP-glycerol glycerophosphotransferase family protein [Snuella sedimenti]|uniref:CDP-glycerol glycerophosphotransferase family protein n=1 Tax=Snuella sedimenti TaxID=2798802 RepID=A0A8J7J713_9FLAO|nr:CDP-glycerol glycerophosphotransferase family protein [Snuella sedimenti]MBJ6369734.1 CDP-glycerol glycerophosphotransferase family protein [Snuella sedimenti]